MNKYNTVDWAPFVSKKSETELCIVVPHRLGDSYVNSVDRRAFNFWKKLPPEYKKKYPFTKGEYKTKRGPDGRCETTYPFYSE